MKALTYNDLIQAQKEISAHNRQLREQTEQLEKDTRTLRGQSLQLVRSGHRILKHWDRVGGPASQRCLLSSFSRPYPPETCLSNAGSRAPWAALRTSTQTHPITIPAAQGSMRGAEAGLGHAVTGEAAKGEAGAEEPDL